MVEGQRTSVPDSVAAPPRFPWHAAIFCIACLVATASTWMLYSWRRRIDLREVIEATPRVAKGRWPHGAYAEVEGVVVGNSATSDEWGAPKTVVYQLAVSDEVTLQPRGAVARRTLPYVRVMSGHREPLHDLGERVRFVGRVGKGPVYPRGAWRTQSSLDARSGHLTVQSKVGLYFGVVGLSVFGVALNLWLSARRIHRDRAGTGRPVPDEPPEVDASAVALRLAGRGAALAFTAPGLAAFAIGAEDLAPIVVLLLLALLLLGLGIYHSIGALRLERTFPVLCIAGAGLLVSAVIIGGMLLAVMGIVSFVTGRGGFGDLPLG
jgi:hypothetical protein